MTSTTRWPSSPCAVMPFVPVIVPAVRRAFDDGLLGRLDGSLEERCHPRVLHHAHADRPARVALESRLREPPIAGSKRDEDVAGAGRSNSAHPGDPSPARCASRSIIQAWPHTGADPREPLRPGSRPSPSSASRRWMVAPADAAEGFRDQLGLALLESARPGRLPAPAVRSRAWIRRTFHQVRCRSPAGPSDISRTI